MKNIYKASKMKFLTKITAILLLFSNISYSSEIGIIGFVIGDAFNQDGKKLNVGDPIYFGDTINTAARLGAACKTTGSSFLISAALATEIGLPQTVTATAVDPLSLSGKEAPFEALALKLAVNEAA